MNQNPLRVDLFFDADDYYRSGFCPWTFFAYPTSIADDRGLPPDEVACEILARVQGHGIPVAIWVSGVPAGTTYFACRQEDIQRLHHLLTELEDSGAVDPEYLKESSERLFARSERH